MKNILTFLFLGATVTLYSQDCPADFDGDGFVGIGDVSSFIGAYSTIGDTVHDLDNDGLVNAGDVMFLVDEYGQFCLPPCSGSIMAYNQGIENFIVPMDEGEVLVKEYVMHLTGDIESLDYLYFLAFANGVNFGDMIEYVVFDFEGEEVIVPFSFSEENEYYFAVNVSDLDLQDEQTINVSIYFGLNSSVEDSYYGAYFGINPYFAEGSICEDYMGSPISIESEQIYFHAMKTDLVSTSYAVESDMLTLYAFEIETEITALYSEVYIAPDDFVIHQVGEGAPFLIPMTVECSDPTMVDGYFLIEEEGDTETFTITVYYTGVEIGTTISLDYIEYRTEIADEPWVYSHWLLLDHVVTYMGQVAENTTEE